MFARITASNVNLVGGFLLLGILAAVFTILRRSPDATWASVRGPWRRRTRVARPWCSGGRSCSSAPTASRIRLEDHRGDVASGGPDRLRYSRDLLAIGDVVVWVKPRRPKPLYDPQAFEQYVRPLLRNAHPMSRVEAMLTLARTRHPQVAVHLLLLLPLVAWVLSGPGPG